MKSYLSLIPISAAAHRRQNRMTLLCITFSVFMVTAVFSVAQRTRFFGIMRCIGMSRQQIIRFVRLESLNWCKTAVPAGLILGIIATWALCAALRFLVGEEFSHTPLFGVSIIGIISGIAVGLAAVLLAAGTPAKRAAKVPPVAAVAGSVRMCPLCRKRLTAPHRICPPPLPAGPTLSPLMILICSV